MQENFELETILTITTGINLTDNLERVYELAWFVYDDELINGMGLNLLSQPLKKHLLNIHPQLKQINYIPQSKSILKKWIEIQKVNFGDYLPVSKFGKELDEEKTMIK